MDKQESVFLICPVRQISDRESAKIKEYVSQLEGRGYKVHWPPRDTRQDCPTGGYDICRTNFQAIMEACEIHVWYNEASSGSKFDMGGVFMLVEMLGWKKKIIIANENEITNNAAKSFFKVFKHLAEKT